MFGLPIREEPFAGPHEDRGRPRRRRGALQDPLELLAQPPDAGAVADDFGEGVHPRILSHGVVEAVHDVEGLSHEEYGFTERTSPACCSARQMTPRDSAPQWMMSP